MFAFGSAEID
jgi:regulator of chromosome condensation